MVHILVFANFLGKHEQIADHVSLIPNALNSSVGVSRMKGLFLGSRAMKRARLD